MPSGEALLGTDVELVRKAFGNTILIVNQYGPTECSMISTMYPIPREFQKELQTIPVGKPISNARAYILDQFLQPVPVGVKGELYIGGLEWGEAT